LNIEVCIIHVHFAGEHAAKLQRSELFLKFTEVALYFADRVGIVFFFCELQELFGFTETRRQIVEQMDHLLELCTFLPQRLRTFRLAPYVRLFEFALYFSQAL
jgi:7-cyano-7-deazaguanine synthase in queuosine biosynthesis